MFAFLLSSVLSCGQSSSCAGDFTADNRVNMDDLLAVVAGWGDCNLDHLLSVINGWGECDVPYLRYDQVPRFACNNRELFASLLFGTPADRAALGYDRIITGLEHGDSTSDSWGSPGSHFQAHLRHQFFLHFGHTPATAWTHGSQGAGGTQPPAEWLMMTGATEVGDPLIPDTHLPPGFGTDGGPMFPRAKSYRRSHAFGGQGLILHLLHANQNESQLGGSPKGFNYIPSAINVGSANYAIGTMLGGKSIINCNPSHNGGGLRLRIKGYTHPDSDSSVYWKVFAQEDTSSFVNEDGQAPIAHGTAFGDGQSLTAPIGTAYVYTSNVLPALSGNDKLYSAIVTSHVNDGSKSVQVEAQFVSDDTSGLAWDTISYGGFAYRPNIDESNHTLLGERASCGFSVKAMDPAFVMIRQGINDDDDADGIRAGAEELIAFFRGSSCMNDPDFPIILVVPTDYDLPPVDYDEYAGALYQVMQETSNCMIVNLRRILEENCAWGSGSEGAYYLASEVAPLRIHHSPLGAEMMARLLFEEMRNNLAGPNATTYYRQPEFYSADYQDSQIVDGSQADSNFGISAVSGVGFATTNRRVLCEVDMTAIPKGSSVVENSFKWTSYVSTASASAQPYSVFGDLNGGDLNGDSLTIGCTWNHKDAPKGTAAWKTPGGDFAMSSALFTGNLATELGPIVWHGPAFESHIAAKLRTDARVIRTVAKGDTESAAVGLMNLRTKDWITINERPKFHLQYVPPHFPITGGAVKADRRSIHLSFEGADFAGATLCVPHTATVTLMRGGRPVELTAAFTAVINGEAGILGWTASADITPGDTDVRISSIPFGSVCTSGGATNAAVQNEPLVNGSEAPSDGVDSDFGHLQKSRAAELK